ncbi:unnamed protein product [Arabis nemorensis]|uniref:Uncharacterized protein n=1 Tax=Arabis nemorensis TaxID=586526 RepID=A0A565BZQ7_9BRAS|nr:unnamed protein product [Arabis nemorensis]
MSRATYIVGALAGYAVIAYVCDKAWWATTEERFQAWPRTAGPPVAMNPISRQNFIVKTRPE